MKSPDIFEKLCKNIQDTVIYVGDDPSLVKQFVKYLAPKHVIKEEEIIRQGDEGDYFYCIESGKYDVIVNGKKVSEFDNKVFNKEILQVYIIDLFRDALVKLPYFIGTKPLIFLSKFFSPVSLSRHFLSKGGARKPSLTSPLLENNASSDAEFDADTEYVSLSMEISWSK